MSAIFVTGAGTDVGKTFVTAGLIRHLRARGVAVEASKPVVSGFDDAGAAADDSNVLLGALGRDRSAGALDRISPWRFRAAISPDMAAAREGRTIDFDALVAHGEKAIGALAPDGALLIEGVGGVLVPLDRTHTVADWIDALHVPVALVCGTYLGAISHALSALEVLRRRGRDVRALAASESADSTVPFDETLATLSRFAGAVPVVGIARDAEPGDVAFGELARALGLGFGAVP